MADRFWVGGTGTWNETAHWSTSSGGGGGASKPAITDDVYFDENSFSVDGQTVTIRDLIVSTFRSCKCANFDSRDVNRPVNFMCYGMAGVTPTFECHGSFYLSDLISFVKGPGLYGGEFEWRSPEGSIIDFGNHIISTNPESYTFTQTYIVIAIWPTGNVQVTGNITTQEMYILPADDTTIDFNMTLNIGFISLRSPSATSTNANVNFNDSQITLQNAWTNIPISVFENGYWGETEIRAVNIDPGTSKIYCTADTNYISLSDTSFNDIELSAGKILKFAPYGLSGPVTTLPGNGIIHDLTMGAGSSLYVGSINTLYVTGDMTIDGVTHSYIRSVVSGTRATISKASGTVNGQYLDIKDSYATGGAVWNACGAVDSGNNRGWDFSCITDYYDREGEPIQTGVYTLGRYSNQYPQVLDLTYPISERNGPGDFVLTGVEIGSILIDGNDVYVSWKRNNNGYITYGIDKIDPDKRLYGAYIESRVLSGNREQLGNFSNFVISYAHAISGTDVDLLYSTDYGENWVTTTKVKDTDRQIIYANQEEVESTILQLKVITYCTDNNSPDIERIDIVMR